MKRRQVYYIIAGVIAGVILNPGRAVSAKPDKQSAQTGKNEPQDEVFIYDDRSQRDPFWPLVTPSGAIITHDKDLTIADMVLEGIMTENNGDNTAIINGRILKSNDAIGPFVIKDIAADQVILQKGSKIFTLKLKKED